MAKRMLIMLAVVLVIIGGLGFFKFHQIQSAVQAASNFQMPPVAVTTIVAKREQWPAGMNAIGTVEAVQGVTVSADLPGIVAKIDFESGKYVNKGDVLVELDTRQERAQLAATEAQRDLAKINFGRSQQLATQGVISRSEYDKSSADQRQTEANVAELKA